MSFTVEFADTVDVDDYLTEHTEGSTYLISDAGVLTINQDGREVHFGPTAWLLVADDE